MSALGGLRLTSLASLLGAGARPLTTGARPIAPGLGTSLTVAGALDRARGAGHRDDVVAGLAHVLPRLPVDTRVEVVDPLGRASSLARVGGPAVRPLTLAGALARQVDGTTCGSAVLALLAAAGDPVLALWLVTGTALDGAPATAGTDPAPGPRVAPDRSSGGASPGGAEHRWRRLQHIVKARTGRKALGPFPWPGALGTPPWGAARTARYADVRFTHHAVDGARGYSVLGAALDAAARGIPVPLFTGGDLSGGVTAAVPRHVVLLVAADAATTDGAAGRSGPVRAPGTAASGRAGTPGVRRCWVYEPSSGTVHRLDAARLAAGGQAAAVRRALGGWPHVVWAILPA
ncbi:hypothetical protein [Cellulosimicrobium sp. Marseille-Q4280]|uniref:hypothetical protein n=1 Tax=Cellulosimicrobium sp. Marseille-Q4280 TaxID=2937992 RepID=UPI00203B5249|nr:hypothetical protein [Cellulosimicrobium sp. Marseille-Q4280]